MEKIKQILATLQAKTEDERIRAIEEFEKIHHEGNGRTSMVDHLVAGLLDSSEVVSEMAAMSILNIANSEVVKKLVTMIDVEDVPLRNRVQYILKLIGNRNCESIMGLIESKVERERLFGLEVLVELHKKNPYPKSILPKIDAILVSENNENIFAVAAELYGTVGGVEYYDRLLELAMERKGWVEYSILVMMLKQGGNEGRALLKKYYDQGCFTEESRLLIEKILRSA